MKLILYSTTHYVAYFDRQCGLYHVTHCEICNEILIYKAYEKTVMIDGDKLVLSFSCTRHQNLHKILSE